MRLSIRFESLLFFAVASRGSRPMSTDFPFVLRSDPSLLDPTETNVRTPGLPDAGLGPSSSGLSETFRHSGWARTRSTIYDSLRRTRQTISRINAFESCGYQSWVYRSVDPPHRYRLAGSHCHDRFCVPCARDRSHTIAANVAKHLQGRTVRFATLTVRHSTIPLARQLDRLYSAFRSLRSGNQWLHHVVGGAAFLEFTWSADTGSWHPHLHIIIEGNYFPVSLLSSLWHDATGDSYIVDLRAIKDERRVLSYVTKYATKAVSNTYLSIPDRLDEAIRALRGRRLCLTFGSWRGLKLTECPADGDWECLGLLDDVCIEALAGDTHAAEALQAVLGDRVAEILGRVLSARPPPLVRSPDEKQLTFAFPLADPTF